MLIENIDNIIKYTKKLNILYVEDNIEVQEQTCKMLDSFFNTITTANNGKIATDYFITEKFDLVITDIEMPHLDGTHFIDFIRKSNKQIPIIVLSAYGDSEYLLKTINSGIDAYLLKPYSLVQISEALDNIVKKYFAIENVSNLIELENGFVWDNFNNRLYKNNEDIKLTRNETKLFNLYLSSNSNTKTYEEIEDYIFDNCDDNIKKIRNLLSRLKTKLNYELFETLYSYGYSLKYKRD